jgi:pSer/pThr/pTyr-binding forkhead associated (FHA) protein
MAKMLILAAVTGAQVGKRFTLSGRNSVIGSAPGCDMVLHDRLIEPRHAEIRSMLESWFIVPLASGGSGLSVNGVIAHGQSRIRPGDKVTIGSTTFTIAVEEFEEREVGAPHSTSSGGVPRLGEYLTQRGLLTQEQVQRAIDRQTLLQRSGISKQLGEVAYEMGFLNRGQLDRILTDQRNEFNSRWRD